MAQHFPATDQNFVNLGDAKQFDPVNGLNLTVCAWVNGDALSGTQVVVARDGGAGGWWLGASGTAIHFSGWNFDLNFTTPALSNGKWFFIACAISPTKGHAVRIDTGGNISTQDISNTTSIAALVNSTATIGGTSGGSFRFQGSIKNVAVWNRQTLTDTQLRAFAFQARTSHSVPRPSFYMELGEKPPFAEQIQVLGLPIALKNANTAALATTSYGVADPTIPFIPARPRLALPDIERLLGSGTTITDISDSDSATLSSAVLTAGIVKTDTDTFSTAEGTTLAATVTSTDSGSASAAAPSISLTSSDTLAETDSGALTDAVPPPAPQADTFTASSTGSIAATLSSSDSGAFAESASAVVASALAISDSDIVGFAELGSNASGGIASAFNGVVLAFDDTALAASPTWTRLDDPNGVA